MYLGVRAVLAKSFARIHQDNLVNFGIVPLTFTEPADHEGLEQGDELVIPDARVALRDGRLLAIHNRTQDQTYTLTHHLSPRQVSILLAGGLLNHVRNRS